MAAARSKPSFAAKIPQNSNLQCKLGSITTGPATMTSPPYWSTKSRLRTGFSNAIAAVSNRSKCICPATRGLGRTSTRSFIPISPGYKTAAERTFRRCLKDVETYFDRQHRREQLDALAAAQLAAIDRKWLSKQTAPPKKSNPPEPLHPPLPENDNVENNIVEKENFENIEKYPDA